jgi:hypothetical protein
LLWRSLIRASQHPIFEHNRVPLIPQTHAAGGAMSRLKRLIVEAHQRSLWQVLGIYVVGAW